MNLKSLPTPSSPILTQTNYSYSTFDSIHDRLKEQDSEILKEDGLRHTDLQLKANIQVKCSLPCCRHIRLQCRCRSDQPHLLGFSFISFFFSFSLGLSCSWMIDVVFSIHRQYKQLSFASDLALIIASLRIPTWQNRGGIRPQDLTIQKVSGSLTNAVFFVSRPEFRTLLLRVYGPSSGSLVSRPRELHTLHVLSSKYRFGPRIYGTFGNGRIEEYFESNPLTPADLRDPITSQYIATRMAELHHVDIDSVEGKGWEVGVRQNIRTWIKPAMEVLALADLETSNFFNLQDFVDTWEVYWNWIRRWENQHGESPRVFAHNDAQYGNLLRLKNPSPSRPPHHQIVVVDFEYASPNPAAFDIANHFHEWTADYHCSTPWLLQPSLFPSRQQRMQFYTAYLKAGRSPESKVKEDELDLLERQVHAWSPASHALWTIWGIVQAREEIETGEEGDFEYLKYARCRIAAFRNEVAALQL